MGRPNSFLQQGSHRGSEGRQVPPRIVSSRKHSLHNNSGIAMTLLELQRRMSGVIMAPLARRNSGGPERKEAEALVKPNSRLTSLERLDIYRRSYWYRLLDSL